MARYDAVVIGSGLGGLAAAAELARSGLSVRLLEKHTQAGGYATTFCRGRFEFEVSLHALSGVAAPGTREGPSPLQQLGVEQQLEFVRLPDLYRTVATGLDLRVPAGREESLRALIDAFPHEAPGLRRFHERLWVINDDVQSIGAGTDENPTPIDAIRHHPVLSHAAAVSLASLLYREVTDPLARLAAGQCYSYFGLPPEQLSLLYFAIGFTTLAEVGPTYPIGKSQSISNAFVRVIEAAGGEVSLGNGAARILLKNRRVAGVLTESGERIECTRVISNANPFTTFFDLIDRNQVDHRFLRRLSGMRPSMSTVSLYLGFDASAREIGLADHEVFVNNTVNMERQYASAWELEPPDSFLITAYSACVPNFSPAGTSVATLTAATEGRVWRDLPAHRYHEVKERYASEMLQTAAKLYPKMLDHVEVAVVSTPLTNMRYTGNQDGAIYGLAQTPAQCPAFRLGRGDVIGGLWLAGAWTQPGGGYEPVIESGREAASDLMRDLAARTESVTSAPVAAHAPAAAVSRGRRMSREHWRLVADLHTVVSTLAQANGIGTGYRHEFERGEIERDVAWLHADALPVRIVETRWETPGTKTLRLVAEEGALPPVRPGQYVKLSLSIEDSPTSRALSVSSPPGDDAIEVTVKRKPGGFVSHHLVDRARPGQIVHLTGPSGEFFYNPMRDGEDLVFIAAGSGIVPFAGMIEHLLATRLGVRVLLLYGSRCEAQIIFRDRLERLQRTHTGRFKLVHTLSQPNHDWFGERGRIRPELLQRELSGVCATKRTYFLCGPKAMVTNTLEQLGAMGVRPGRIQVEAFGGPDDVTEIDGWPPSVSADHLVTVRLGDGRKLSARSGESLMVALERGGVEVASSCRIGACGACRSRLVAGEIFTPKSAILRASDHESGFVHLCAGFPLTDVELELTNKRSV